jgi:hypothetical protein
MLLRLLRLMSSWSLRMRRRMMLLAMTQVSTKALSMWSLWMSQRRGQARAGVEAVRRAVGRWEDRFEGQNMAATHLHV